MVSGRGLYYFIRERKLRVHGDRKSNFMKKGRTKDLNGWWYNGWAQLLGDTFTPFVKAARLLSSYPTSVLKYTFWINALLPTALQFVADLLQISSIGRFVQTGNLLEGNVCFLIVMLSYSFCTPHIAIFLLYSDILLVPVIPDPFPWIFFFFLIQGGVLDLWFCLGDDIC